MLLLVYHHPLQICAVYHLSKLHGCLWSSVNMESVDQISRCLKIIHALAICSRYLGIFVCEVMVISFSISAKLRTLISLASLVLNSSIRKLSCSSGNSEFSRFKILFYILEKLEDIFSTIFFIKSLVMSNFCKSYCFCDEKL